MNITEKLKAFYAKSKRVWLVLRKPTKKEFEMIAKVSAFGILILGALGFLISIVLKLFLF